MSAPRRRRWGAKASLAVVGLGVAGVVAWGALAVGERAGWLRDLRPPPHFSSLRGADGRVLRDAKGREIFAIDEGVAALVGKAGIDRLWSAKEKDDGVVRVLSVGESTTFGAGYQGKASFSRVLETRLRQLIGRDSIEVVNCGKNGNDSSHWLTLVDELDDFAPDLLVVYVGHNETKKPNLVGVLDPAKARLRRSRLLRRFFGEPEDDVKPPPSVGVGRFLTPEQRAFALELFDEGLRALLEFGRDHGVPVVVCIPASNVLDARPRYSIVREGPDAAARREEVLAAGAEFTDRELPDLGAPDADADARAAAEAALARIDAALAADPDAAVLHYRKGRILAALGRDDEARAALERSLELDDLPERAAPDFVARTRALATEHGALVADVERRFARATERAAPGNDLFIDYCHPNLFGHWLIADEIVQALAAADGAGVAGLAGLRAALAAADESGASDRERCEALGRELGLTEADAARFQVERAMLEIGNLGTRVGVHVNEWRIPEEFLKAAARQDPTLPKENATWHVLRGTCRAALHDRAETRRFLLDAHRLDREETRDLARKMKQLPSLVAAFGQVGVTLEDDGFRWKGE